MTLIDFIPGLKEHCHGFTYADRTHFKCPFSVPIFFKYPFPSRVYPFSAATAATSSCHFEIDALT